MNIPYNNYKTQMCKFWEKEGKWGWDEENGDWIDPTLTNELMDREQVIVSKEYWSRIVTLTRLDLLCCFFTILFLGITMST